MNLRDKNVLITGASAGLGRALALALAERGAAVALVARRLDALEAVAASIRAAGGTAHAIAADVGAPDAAARIAGEAAAVLGPIDVLIHNASDLGPLPLRPLLEIEPEQLRDTFEVNVLGPFRLGRLIAGPMSLRGRGTIVSISSDAARDAYPTWGAYGASKAALDQLHAIWTEELRPQGINVWAIDPTEMDTQMHRDALPDADPTALARPEVVAQAILRVLEGRTSPPATRFTVQVDAPEAVAS